MWSQMKGYYAPMNTISRTKIENTLLSNEQRGCHRMIRLATTTKYASSETIVQKFNVIYSSETRNYQREHA